MPDAGSPRNANPKVCAVVGRATEPLHRALREQSRVPDVVVDDDAGLRAGIERAIAAGADWIWVLDGSAAPRPGALEGLLHAAAGADGLPDPAVLVGVVIGPDGHADRTRSIWYDSGEPDLALAAADRHLLPIRATAGPVLVARRAAEAELPPAEARVLPGTVFEWTARMLRERTGYLVPASESDALFAVRDPLGDPLTALRLVRAGAVTGRDRLVLGYKLAERMAERVSARAAAGRRGGR